MPERYERFHEVIGKWNEPKLVALDDDDLLQVMTAAQILHDLAMNVAEQRGLVSERMGAPVIPYCWPESFEWPMTVLTR